MERLSTDDIAVVVDEGVDSFRVDEADRTPSHEGEFEEIVDANFAVFLASAAQMRRGATRSFGGVEGGRMQRFVDGWPTLNSSRRREKLTCLLKFVELAKWRLAKIQPDVDLNPVGGLLIVEYYDDNARIHDPRHPEWLLIIRREKGGVETQLCQRTNVLLRLKTPSDPGFFRDRDGNRNQLVSTDRALESVCLKLWSPRCDPDLRAGVVDVSFSDWNASLLPGLLGNEASLMRRFSNASPWSFLMGLLRRLADMETRTLEPDPLPMFEKRSGFLSGNRDLEFNSMGADLVNIPIREEENLPQNRQSTEPPSKGLTYTPELGHRRTLIFFHGQTESCNRWESLKNICRMKGLDDFRVIIPEAQIPVDGGSSWAVIPGLPALGWWMLRGTGNCWDRYHPTSWGEACVAAQKLISHEIEVEGIPPENIFVSGFSIGGAVACRVMGTIPFDLGGCISIEGFNPMEGILSQSYFQFNKSSPILLLQLIRDYQVTLVAAQRASKQFKGIGLKCHLETYEYNGFLPTHDMAKAQVIDMIRFLRDSQTLVPSNQQSREEITETPPTALPDTPPEE